MSHYDIVFIGQMGMGEIVPFDGPPFTEPGSPLLFAVAATACLGKQTAAVTSIAAGQEHLLDPLKESGVDLFVRFGGIYQYKVVFPTANADQRQIFRIQVGEPFTISDIPPFEPCLIHVCTMGVRKFQLELLRDLKAKGFRLAVDMQSFVQQGDHVTGIGEARLEDVPEKEEIARMSDFVKLDAAEAQILTGFEVLQHQADTLEDWGSSETIITCSEGVLARSKGKTTFAKFTNRITQGRMGRGDTVMGSYLARRLDHSVEDSLRFAVALTSIKLEAAGPFKGSVEGVLSKMQQVE